MMDSTLSFTTALIGLILSIAVFGVLYRRKQKQSNIINLIAYQSLGSKKGVAVIRVGNEILVIGVVPNGITVLKTLAAKEVLETMDEASSEQMEKLRQLKEKIDE
jgi:flagellar biogenesis protein FliO